MAPRFLLYIYTYATHMHTYVMYVVCFHVFISEVIQTFDLQHIIDDHL